ncbi:MAG: hypothetical protein V4671_15835 [Armatimonadota bacterium]
MKVIAHGIFADPPRWWIGQEFACEYCECRFVLEKDDALIPSRDVRNPDIEIVSVRCPECRYVLRLPREPDNGK